MSASGRYCAAELSVGKWLRSLPPYACSTARAVRCSERNRTTGSVSQSRIVLFLGRWWASLKFLGARVNADLTGVLAGSVRLNGQLVIQESRIGIHPAARKRFLI